MSLFVGSFPTMCVIRSSRVVGVVCGVMRHNVLICFVPWLYLSKPGKGSSSGEAKRGARQQVTTALKDLGSRCIHRS